MAASLEVEIIAVGRRPEPLSVVCGKLACTGLLCSVCCLSRIGSSQSSLLLFPLELQAFSPLFQIELEISLKY